MATSSESYIVVAGATFVFGLGIEGYYGERHRFNVRTTEYPVETGADLTDHVVREPYRVKLRGAATAFARGVSAGPDAWGSAIAHINRREPVTIITRLGTYRNMMLVSGDATVDENTERSLDVDLEFKEVLRAHVMRSPVSAGSSAAGGIPTEGRALDRIERAAFGRVEVVQPPLAVIEENARKLILNNVIAMPMPVPFPGVPAPVALPRPVPPPP